MSNTWNWFWPKAQDQGSCPIKRSENVPSPCSLKELACSLFQFGVALPHVSVNNTHFPFPQQLSQLPKSTESEAGGWGGESYKEIRESLTSLGRSMGCFTRQMDGISKSLNLFLPHTHTEQWGGGGGGGEGPGFCCCCGHVTATAVCHKVVGASWLLRCVVWTSKLRLPPFPFPSGSHYVCWCASLGAESKQLSVTSWLLAFEWCVCGIFSW